METKTRWERLNDPFLGACAVVRGLNDFDPELDKLQRDYVAHLTNISETYGYERRFLKKRYGKCVIPCDRLGDGAVIEVRMGGTREYFRCVAGEMERIGDGDVRASIAMWRFSTGQSLHTNDGGTI